MGPRSPRSLPRLAGPPVLRGWALDHARQWAGVVQEELIKFRGANPTGTAPAAVPKSGAAANQFFPPPSKGGEAERKAEKEKASEEEEDEDRGEASPVRARSSGVNRRRERRDSRSQRRSPSRSLRRRVDRRREDYSLERGVSEERGKERKRTRSSRRRDSREDARRGEYTRPAEPREPPPSKGRGRGTGKGRPQYPPRPKGKAKAKAKAKAIAKAKAKAVPKARAGGRLARHRGRAPAGEAEGAEGDFSKGDWCDAASLAVDHLKEGAEVVAEGTYWGAPCQVCGKVSNLLVQGDGTKEVSLKLTGTDNEELLKWASGSPSLLTRLHLCGTRCPNLLDANGLVHGVRIRKKTEADRGGWTDNLHIDVDELAGLREEALRKEAEDKRKSAEDKKEKTKKRKKDSSGSSEKKSKKGKKGKKSRVKPEGQKSLGSLFAKTGLDPTPKVRRRVKSYVRRKLKKKKSSSSDSSSTKGSRKKDKGSSEEEDSQESEELFEDPHRVRRLATHGAGVLAAETIKEMQRQLLTTTGQVWEQDAGAIPAVALQFYRQRLMPQLSGGPSREALTLSWCLDLLLQGRAASCADALGQRLKSIELVASGASWSVAQKVEVCPQERATLSSRSEKLSASKEDREEQRTKQLSKGKGSAKGDSSQTPWWKGTAKSEGKGKDGKNKTKKGEKEDAKK
eukprot:Skav212856  [mRNA]  locus=scaffold786:242245:244658:+ [translate_table: standard]